MTLDSDLSCLEYDEMKDGATVRIHLRGSNNNHGVAIGTFREFPDEQDPKKQLIKVEITFVREGLTRWRLQSS